MNIHPIFVHFPIAFLTIYAICELFSIRSLKNNQTWEALKMFLLVVGFLGAVSAVSTGEMAEEFVKRTVDSRMLIETHAFFAVFSEWIFGILAFSYIFSFLETKGKLQKFFDLKIYKIISFLSKKIMRMRVFLSVLGLVVITITGALGGAIVYGKDADPIVSFVYKIFFGQ